MGDTFTPGADIGFPIVIESNGESPNTNGTSVKVGMKCAITNLYQKEDERGRITWTVKYPDDIDEAAENEGTARYAILVRNKKSSDSRKKLEIVSIIIQSPLLKQVLSTVLKDYPGKSHSSPSPFTYQDSNNPFRSHSKPKSTYLSSTVQSIRPSLGETHQRY